VSIAGATYEPLGNPALPMRLTTVGSAVAQDIGRSPAVTSANVLWRKQSAISASR
jgi:hypothetical protein